MAKPSAVITLTGILDKRFKVVEDPNAPLGVYLVYNGKKYEPDLSLHEVLGGRCIDGDVAYFDDDGFTASGFESIDGSIIKL
jgi:hypothetical protein